MINEIISYFLCTVFHVRSSKEFSTEIGIKIGSSKRLVGR